MPRRHIEVGTEVVAKRMYDLRSVGHILGTATRYGRSTTNIPIGTKGVVEDVGERKYFRNTWKVYLVRFDDFEPLWVVASDIVESV